MRWRRWLSGSFSSVSLVSDSGRVRPSLSGLVKLGRPETDVEPEAGALREGIVVGDVSAVDEAISLAVAIVVVHLWRIGARGRAAEAPAILVEGVPNKTPATRRNNLRMEAPESLRVAITRAATAQQGVKPRVTKENFRLSVAKKPQTAHSPSSPLSCASLRRDASGRAPIWPITSAAARLPSRPQVASGAPWVRP